MATIGAQDVSRFLDQAADSIDVLAKQAKDALKRASAHARQSEGSLSDMRDNAWRIAERARNQAGDMAGDLYARSRDGARVVKTRIEEQPLMAVVIVGVIALSLGYLMRNSR